MEAYAGGAGYCPTKHAAEAFAAAGERAAAQEQGAGGASASPLAGPQQVNSFPPAGCSLPVPSSLPPRAARHDLVGTNIRVTSIQPGAVKVGTAPSMGSGRCQAAQAWGLICCGSEK